MTPDNGPKVDGVPVEPQDLINITKVEYDELVASQNLLLALQAGGVDNWEWYWESVKHLYEDED